MEPKLLLNHRAISITLNRLCCELIENHRNFEDTVLVALQPRGTAFGNQLVQVLKENYHMDNLKYGQLDITFFRDDFRRREGLLKPSQTQMNFLVEGKKVVLIDDVLFTGRSIRSALDALQSFGRPSSVELCVLIDRRLSRHLPIQPNYVGHKVDSVASERVSVDWQEDNHSVLLMGSKEV